MIVQEDHFETMLYNNKIQVMQVSVHSHHVIQFRNVDSGDRNGKEDSGTRNVSGDHSESPTGNRKQTNLLKTVFLGMSLGTTRYPRQSSSDAWREDVDEANKRNGM